MEQVRNMLAFRVPRPSDMGIPVLGSLFLAILLVLVPSREARAADAGIETHFDPAVIAPGETGDLIVTVAGADAGQPTLASVPGLHLAYVGRGSRMEMMNGRTTMETTFQYRVWADEPGRYILPPVRVRIGGEERTSDPATLDVTKGASQASRRRAASSAADIDPLDEEGVGGSRVDATVPAFLRVRLERTSPFVGEVVPVGIEAWFPEDAGGSLDALPRPDDPAFTLEIQDDEAQQERRQAGGRIWKVLTWQGTLSGVKAGHFPLHLTMEATLQVRDRRARRRRPSRRRSPFGSLLGSDPFGDDFFGGGFFDDFFAPVRQVKVTLESDPLDLDLQELPTEGRPAGFQGAVGRFDVEAFLDPAVRTSTVGDPLTLVTRVTGEGNFDRVRAPVLQDTTGWKTYPPDRRGDVADARPGEKTFEQVIVPTEPDLDGVPPVVFSYFDPLLGTYESVRTGKIPLRLVDAPAGPRLRPATSEMPETPDAATPSASAPDAEDARVPDRTPGDDAAATLMPLIRRPGARWAFGCIGTLLGAGLFLTLRRRRHERDPAGTRKRRRDRALAQALDELDRAAERGDEAAAVLASRRALCDLLRDDVGEGCEASSLTLRDVTARWPDAPPGVAEAFEAIDAVTYAGAGLGAEGLDALRSAVRRAVEAIGAQEEIS